MHIIYMMYMILICVVAVFVVVVVVVDDDDDVDEEEDDDDDVVVDDDGDLCFWVVDWEYFVIILPSVALGSSSFRNCCSCITVQQKANQVVVGTKRGFTSAAPVIL